MKTATPCLTVLFTLAMSTVSGPVLSQSTGVPPFFPFMVQKAQPRAATPAFPWQPRRPLGSRPAFAAPRVPFAPPMAGPTPFGAGFGGGGFGMPGMSSGLGMMTAPMMQGMVGMMAPFAVNYLVASMNPTTMGNFFGLMARPSGFGVAGFHPMGVIGNPMGGFGAAPPAGFPFGGTFRQTPATGFPLMRPARPRQNPTPMPFAWPRGRTAPAKPAQREPSTPRQFPFPPFSIVGK